MISLSGLRELELPLADVTDVGNLQEVMDIWGEHCGGTVEFWKGDLKQKRGHRRLTMAEIANLFARFQSLRVVHFVNPDEDFEDENWRAGRREDCLIKLAYGIPSLEEIQFKPEDGPVMSAGISWDGGQTRIEFRPV
jgi:hypothetical protein